MPPFFLDVWMEIATENQGVETRMVDKKTLFFIPSNDDQIAPGAQKKPKRKPKN